ncbi:hypothetical protein HELRODRAFT_166800 [Helobdella robusta]|uniref:Uncharacterized protein n=1 Tax=Helobdella robusta TaxID=6412 RepID=T1EYJ5_HELRO|nr:hypothetical protein HELRODRAFT_166800 [Helobdella robusta]ESO11763.1 hypothetical protein HELRODRAFT_166800 [Helobdella robusta]
MYMYNVYNILANRRVPTQARLPRLAVAFVGAQGRGGFHCAAKVHNWRPKWGLFKSDRYDRSRNETFLNFLVDRAGSTENILESRYRVGQQLYRRQLFVKLFQVFWVKGLIMSRVLSQRNPCQNKFHRLVRHHELLKPGRFDGAGCLKIFLRRIEICTRYNQWSLNDMEAYLSCSLTDEAAEFLRNIAGLVKNLTSLAYPSEQSKLAIHLTKDFLSALSDTNLELKLPNALSKECQTSFSQAIKRARITVTGAENQAISKKECPEKEKLNKRWVLRSALNFASDEEAVASAREQDMKIYEKRKRHEQLEEQQS